MPSKKGQKKVVNKNQPAVGGIEKATNKEEKKPEKGVDKVAKAVAPNHQDKVTKVKPQEDAKDETRVKLGNLNFSVTEDNCREFFKDCGELTSVEWINLPNGNFSGCGVLTFETPEAAAQAVAKNGTEFLGRRLKAAYASASQPTSNTEPTNTIVLRNLSYKATARDIRHVFASIDDTVQTRISASGGVGFAEFSSVENATKGLEIANGANILGRVVNAEYALPREVPKDEKPQRLFESKNEGTRTMFLGNLPSFVEEDDIKKAFNGCNISGIRFLESNGQFKGVGFVEFVTEEDADKAYNLAKDGFEVAGRRPNIDWAAPKTNKSKH